MEFKDIVRKNRSYRGYDESRVLTREELVELVDMARLTPSAMNGQPFSYYVACEKEQLEVIQPLTKWAAALPHLNLPREGKRPTGFIVICQNMEISENLQQYKTDLGIVAQTICLGAGYYGTTYYRGISGSCYPNLRRMSCSNDDNVRNT